MKSNPIEINLHESISKRSCFPVVRRTAKVAKLYNFGSVNGPGQSEGSFDQRGMHVLPADVRHKRDHILHDRYIQVYRHQHQPDHMYHNRRRRTGKQKNIICDPTNRINKKTITIV